MTAPRTSRHLATGIVYLAGYVALDWISFEYEFTPLGITPWNPPPALSIVLLLRDGLVFAPWLFAASVLADIVVRGITSVGHLAMSGAIICIGYTCVAAILRRQRLDVALARLRDVAQLVIVASIGSALVAAVDVAASIAVGELVEEDFLPAAFRYWAGDLSGILVLSPLLLRVLVLPRTPLRARATAVDLETTLQVLLLGLAVWFIFGLESTDEFKFFYLMLLPIAWIGLRHGIDGVCLATLGAQLGLLILVAYRGFPADIVTEFQALMMILAIVGLTIGAMATERSEAERTLRRHQAQLSHFSRVSVAGEMVSALAHELSQPLAAASTYAAEAQLLLKKNAAPEELGESLSLAAGQVRRASEVVSRLRNFLHRGEMALARIPVQRLVHDALALVQGDAALNKVRLVVDGDPQPVAIMADAVQMQQVLINLVRNAVEAIIDAQSEERVVRITQRTAGDRVVIAVSDTGPGLPAAIAASVFEPFITTKSEGMGLGLTISRSIVQAHGGTLRHENAPGGGARFVIDMPRAEHDVAAS